MDTSRSHFVLLSNLDTTNDQSSRTSPFWTGNPGISDNRGGWKFTVLNETDPLKLRPSGSQKRLRWTDRGDGQPATDSLIARLKRES